MTIVDFLIGSAVFILVVGIAFYFDDIAGS